MQVGTFEGHLTLEIHTHLQQELAENIGKEHGLHFSWIAGWDELQDDQPKKAFLTGHGSVMYPLQERMALCESQLASANIKVLRFKVELGMMDTLSK